MNLDVFAELLSRRVEPKTHPGPGVARFSNLYGRYLKWRRRARPRELQAEERAIRLAAELAGKFARMTRQQRRRGTFLKMAQEVNQQYAGEPRRARRKIARAWAKRALKEAT